jgi:hypothetical protein
MVYGCKAYCNCLKIQNQRKELSSMEDRRAQRPGQERYLVCQTCIPNSLFGIHLGIRKNPRIL